MSSFEQFSMYRGLVNVIQGRYISLLSDLPCLISQGLVIHKQLSLQPSCSPPARQLEWHSEY